MTAVVELDNVTRRYPGPPETTALDGCALRVDESDFLTVVGPSGSGKSTLLNIVGLLDSPTSGRYLLRGNDTSNMTEGERARLRGELIGFVFQSFQLLEQRTCLENVAMADLYTGATQAESNANALEMLDAVGLGTRAESLPTQLSGGQRQRVAIARALAGHPAILLCDEPTGNLDSHTADTVLELLSDLNRNGVTIMLITHDPDIATIGNRTIGILDGAVREHPTEAKTP